jgi:hypothetical protein
MAESTRRSTTSSWRDEDEYWRTNYGTRPYAAGLGYETYQPGYRYGYEAAMRQGDRNWNEVERDLERDWDTYEYRGTSTWQQVKDAARDAWNRITGR